ncbi:hypothetical protein [Sphingobacterium sp. IITKGP-BTPF85]|nr:hypothetical protein [Sphingobacterium sp. IITKGP-BTPF85]
MARKTYQGEKNDKSRTMTKLIQAVGAVLEKKDIQDFQSRILPVLLE